MNLYLDKGNSPHVIIEVLTSKYIVIDCYIDTGFSGGLSLPNKYEYFFKDKRPISFLTFQLGDGRTKNFDIYDLKIKFRNAEKYIPAFLTDGKDALVGLEFLEGYKFTLDLKKLQIGLD